MTVAENESSVKSYFEKKKLIRKRISENCFASSKRNYELDLFFFINVKSQKKKHTIGQIRIGLHEETYFDKKKLHSVQIYTVKRRNGVRLILKKLFIPRGNVSCIVVQWTAASSRDQEYVNHRRNAFSDKAARTKNAHQKYLQPQFHHYLAELYICGICTTILKPSSVSMKTSYRNGVFRVFNKCLRHKIATK